MSKASYVGHNSGVPKLNAIARLPFVSTVVAAALVLTAPGDASALTLPAPATSTSTVAGGSGIATSSRDSTIRPAADLSQFNPGNIISDALFYDANAMSSSEIQAFLDEKIGSCRTSRCLNILNVSISSRDRRVSQATGQLVCEAIQGGTMRASELIYRVQVACGISAKVILATLQKEQGLVTSKAPSDHNLNAAMGQACPDTAPCDPAFSGVGPQIVGGVNQLKIYKAGRFAKQPGVHYIQYDVDVKCGGTNVNIVNYATAALYNYTPYQPNAASLRAGYGEGDGCSSYGNRNFYQYYTDWFGSTQEAHGDLVKTASAPQIYFLVDGVRRHVQTQEDLAVLMSRLGSVSTISDFRMSRLPLAAPMTRLARDARDGRMYLLQADGTKHHFPSADLVRRYGFAMDDFLALPAVQIDAYISGGAVGDLFRADNGPEVFKWEDNSRRHIFSQLAWNQERRSLGDYVAVLPRGTVNAIRAAAPLLGAGALVKEANSTAVYVAGYSDELIHLPSWALASELGLNERLIVPDTTLRSHRVVGTLAPLLQCGDRVGVVGEGSVNLITGTIEGAASTVPASICSALNWSLKVIDRPVFIGTAGGSRIYTASATTLRHVRDADVQRRLADGKPIRVVSWSPSMINSMEQGAPHLSDGSFAQFADARVFVAEGGALRHVRSIETLRRLAGPGPINVEQLPAPFLTSYPEAAPID